MDYIGGLVSGGVGVKATIKHSMIRQIH